MPEGTGALDRLEYELTLFSRHYLGRVQHRNDQKLDRSAYVILTRLAVESPMSLKELACAFRLDISTINRQVGAMRRQGLVERVPDPDGGLARKIRATDKGLSLLEADRTKSQSGIAMVVSTWTPDEVEQLGTMISRLNTSIENLENNPWPRPQS